MLKFQSVVRMMSDKQIIRAGTDSTNIQGKKVTVHQHNGLNYADAKDIALDVFRNNFYQLSGEAANLANQRVEEFTEKIIERLKSESESLLNSMKDPDMQYALFTAQKAYARTGDTNLSEMLVEALIERSKEGDRTTYQLVLNECITVLEKITNEQLDILSLVFILMKTRRFLDIEKKEVVEFIKSHITRFTDEISRSNTNFQHLVYAGCSSLTTGGYILEQTLLNNYPGIFTKGFSLGEFHKITTNHNDQKLITPHLVEEGKYQLIASSPEHLEYLFDRYQIDHSVRPSILALQNGLESNEYEVRPLLIKIVPEISNLFDLWDNTSLKDMNLTSVGICLAIINLKSKGFDGFDMSKWIG